MIEKLLKLNLQLFGEDGEGGDGGGQATPPEFDVEKLTDEQVASIKEKFGFKDGTDIDSIINDRYARWQEKMENEKNEAARLAKLSEEERQQAIIQKAKDDLEKEKAVFRQEQLLVEKGKQLQAIGIPSDLAVRIQGNTAEEAIKDVKSFKAEWDKAVEAAVNEKLKASVDTPLGGGATPGKPVDISTLTYEEALALKKTNPKAYEQATK